MSTDQARTWQSARTLGANESVPSGMWRKSTAFRHFLNRWIIQDAAILAAVSVFLATLHQSTNPSLHFPAARVVQSRTVRFINGVALDECHRSGALPDARTNFCVWQFSNTPLIQQADFSEGIAQSARAAPKAFGAGRRRDSFCPHHFIPIAQTTEQSRPKRQVAGENPAGDTISEWSSRVMDCRIVEKPSSRLLPIIPSLHKSMPPFLHRRVVRGE
jgi:hypothetical protein